MAHDLELDRTPQRDHVQPVDTDPAAAANASTKFTAGGSIPSVAAPGAQSKTASELAFEPGPGVKALEQLLAAGSVKPEKIVDLIDAHRSESAAMFALVQSRLGAGFAAQVHDAMDLRVSLKRKEIVAGDPTNKDGGYFLASAEEQGARWRTSGGGFQGTAGKNGLDATLRIDGNDQLHARADTKGNGTLAWEHDGHNVGELYAAKNELGARRSWDLGADGNISAGLRHRSHDGTAVNEAFGTYATHDGKLSTEAGLGINQGHAAAMASATYKPSAGDSYTARFNHDAAGTKLTASGTHALGDGASISGAGELFHHANGSTTGSLSGAYDDRDRRVDASVTRNADSTNFHIGDTEKTLAPNLTVTGSLDHLAKDAGQGQTTMRLGERYRSGNLVQGLDLELGRGEHNYLGANGSLDVRLAPNLYGGAFGGFRVEEGHQTTGQLGASLTFTPHEKAALTAAGIFNTDGSFETRLQLDVFKSKIDGVGGLADHKKDALVSLFLSYTTASHRMLDDRYGAPTVSTPVSSDRVMAGIKIKF